MIIQSLSLIYQRMDRVPILTALCVGGAVPGYGHQVAEWFLPPKPQLLVGEVVEADMFKGRIISGASGRFLQD